MRASRSRLPEPPVHAGAGAQMAGIEAGQISEDRHAVEAANCRHAVHGASMRIALADSWLTSPSWQCPRAPLQSCSSCRCRRECARWWWSGGGGGSTGASQTSVSWADAGHRTNHQVPSDSTFPASMCAMMPMLRYMLRGNSRLGSARSCGGHPISARPRTTNSSRVY